MPGFWPIETPEAPNAPQMPEAAVAVYGALPPLTMIVTVYCAPIPGKLMVAAVVGYGDGKNGTDTNDAENGGGDAVGTGVGDGVGVGVGANVGVGVAVGVAVGTGVAVTAGVGVPV